MGDPFGKPSGRTSNRISTSVPDTCRTSLQVMSCPMLKMSNQSSSEGLESGLPMSVLCNDEGKKGISPQSVRGKKEEPKNGGTHGRHEPVHPPESRLAAKLPALGAEAPGLHSLGQFIR